MIFNVDDFSFCKGEFKINIFFMIIRIFIKKKEGVLDIEGKAIFKALEELSFKNISDVKKGTLIEIEFAGKESEIEEFVNKACRELLVNEVIEAFEYEVIKSK